MERFDANRRQFKKWAAQFYEQGFVILENAVPPEMIARLRNDLHEANKASNMSRKNKDKSKHIVHKVFFERSPATVDLIENSVISDFAEYIIADVPGGRGNSLQAHVFHNNAFTVPAEHGRGQAPTWHTDDPPQNVILEPGQTLPKSFRLPVLAMTYMIWLSDCMTPEHGPTHVIPGSHRFCRPAVKEEADKLPCVAACGPAGTAVLINSQLWHRGAANKSDTDRDTLQLSYGRRIIGAKHGTIMNYNMPEHVYKGRSPKLLQRLGFLQGGAYS